MAVSEPAAAAAGDEDGLYQVLGSGASDALASAMSSVTDVPAFMCEFRAKNRLISPEVDPALSLLEMGSVSRRQVHQSVIGALRDDLLARVKVAAAKGDTALLKKLFERVYEYITNDELSPVVLAIMEAGDETVVGKEYWDYLNEEALQHNYQHIYPSLTTKLKARMWSQYPEAFDAEIDALLSKVGDFIPPQSLDELFRVDYYDTNVGRNKQHVSKLVGIVKAAKKMNPVAKIISVFISRCEQPGVAENTRVAIATLLLDFLTQPLFDLVAGENKYLSPPIYKDVAYAAKVILSNWLKNNGADVSLQEITTLALWTDGCPESNGAVDEERVTIMALLFHSYHARSVFANCLANKLSTINTRPPDYGEQAFENPFLPNLTKLFLTSIEAKTIIDTRAPVTAEQVRAPFDSFYPLLLSEMRSDKHYIKVGSSAYLQLGDPRLIDAMQNSLFERRLFCSWGYMLAFPVDSFGDKPCLSRLSRFALVFHAIHDRSSVTNSDGEEREEILSLTFLQQSSEDAE